MSLLKINPFEIAARKNRPLILDGAIGSELHKLGVDTSTPLWSSIANLTAPDLVTKLHLNYISAGADIITTNTFRTNPSVVKYSQYSSCSKIVRAAVKLALNAAIGKSVFVAGSNAPAEDCYQRIRKLIRKELESNHEKHIDLLIDSGVDFVLNETQSHFDEIKIICRHCAQNDIPFIVSLYSDNSKTILSGESISNVFKYITAFGPLAMGVNCINMKSFNSIKTSLPSFFPYGFYLNLGLKKFNDGYIKNSATPKRYSDFVKQNISLGTAFVGSCCGSSPARTKMLKEVVNVSS
jgi:homocysteine S-methyltransferase